jgi:hypothetical protein
LPDLDLGVEEHGEADRYVHHETLVAEEVIAKGRGKKTRGGRREAR